MGQIIGIDAVLFMYLFNRHAEFLPAARTWLQAVEDGRYEAVMSVIGVIEVLTGPKGMGRNDLAAQYKGFIKHFPHLQIAGISEEVVDVASALRGRYRIHTPDAIHLATAIAQGAEKFITNDIALKKVKEIQVETL